MCLKERKKNVCFTANRSPIVYEKSPPDIPDNEFTFAALLQVDVKLHSKCQNCNIKLRARAHMCVGVRIFFFLSLVRLSLERRGRAKRRHIVGKISNSIAYRRIRFVWQVWEFICMYVCVCTCVSVRVCIYVKRFANISKRENTVLDIFFSPLRPIAGKCLARIQLLFLISRNIYTRTRIRSICPSYTTKIYYYK